jgi:translation initiation factor 4E
MTERELEVIVEEVVENEGKIELLEAFGKDRENTEHPLNSTWVLWVDQAGKQTKQNWSQSLKRIIEIDTIEKFWAVVNNIPKSSQLPINSSYYFFRNGIKPAWEDVQNKYGGRWAAQLEKSEQDTRLDNHWIKMLLMVIGEDLEFNDEICGCVISNKKRQYRMSMWTKNCANEKACESLGKIVKEAMDRRNDIEITYNPHDSGKSGGKSGSYQVA